MGWFNSIGGVSVRRIVCLSWIPWVLCLACGPVDEYPGLSLGGTVSERPESFLFLQDHEVIQLEAWGVVFPRVVNIWGVGAPDALYVWGDPDSGWATRVAERPESVRVRLGDKSYEVRASPVTDPAEKARVVASYQAKYGSSLKAMYGRPTTVDDFDLLYRLTPR
ncbi:MAG TPA: DUF2255 family protein [Myxococcales bacterium]|nr:DUF2255 family protein [Myxococcales bacterium]